MSDKNSTFLCAAQRTAIGSFGGSLAAVPATELGAQCIRAVLEKAALPAESVDEVIVGSVLTAGQGQAPARQAALKGGLPESVQAMTVNKVCSSGLKAVMLADLVVGSGAASAIIAGGMESMSQAPYLLSSLRSGARLGHTQAFDSIVADGLWDPYNNFHMGSAAELCAREFKLNREAQDRYAIESYARANAAIENKWFEEEITPLMVREGRAEREFAVDEEPGKGRPDKIPQLKPVFEKDGTVTAANASSINDGAAMMLVCSEAFAAARQLTPLARIVSQGWNAQKPEWFTTAPIGAVQNALAKANLSVDDIDLFEINEAFSAVALVCAVGLKVPSEKLNVCGGAVALGHPIGASGARILTTLLYSLKRTGGRFGAVGICNGGGEATALVVERV